MSPLIKALFNGSIRPCEQTRVKSPEAAASKEKIHQLWEELDRLLPGEGEKKLEEMMDLCYQEAWDDGEERYAQGFALGALLMLEVLERGEGIVKDS